MSKSRKSPKSSKQADYYAELTGMLVEQLRNNPGNWTKPWASTGVGGALPINAVTKKRYKGSNVFYLSAIAWRAGYTSNVWATYKQWQSIKGQVRKGEKGSVGVYWHFAEKEDPDTGKKVKVVWMKTFPVFNLDQVDGDFTGRWFDGGGPELTVTERDAEIDAWFGRTGATVEIGGDAAYYQPSTDTITMPHPDQFDTTEAFYGTLAHEVTHWTGAKTRLDREGGFYGDAGYAFEELVAELGSAFVCGHLGIESAPRPDHAQYIAHWMLACSDNERAVYRAAADAAKACDYLIALADPEGDDDEGDDDVDLPEVPAAASLGMLAVV